MLWPPALCHPRETAGGRFRRVFDAFHGLAELPQSAQKAEPVAAEYAVFDRLLAAVGRLAGAAQVRGVVRVWNAVLEEEKLGGDVVNRG